MGESSCGSIILTGKTTGKISLEVLGVDGKTVLEYTLKK
jgi:hypothetical protein